MSFYCERGYTYFNAQTEIFTIKSATLRQNFCISTEPERELCSDSKYIEATQVILKQRKRPTVTALVAQEEGRRERERRLLLC